MSLLPDELDEEIPWPSFADAISALLFVFIATTFFFMFRLEQQRSSLAGQEKLLRGAESAAQGLLVEAQLCLESQEHEDVSVRPIVEQQSRTMAIYIEPTASNVVEWFPVCSANVSDEAAAVLRMVRRCLAEEVITHTDDYTVILTLEGHTDSRPPGRTCAQRYPSNWELSGARAGAALRRLMCADGACDAESAEQARQLSALAQDRSRLQLIAAGRAETVPAVRALCHPDWPGASTDEPLDEDVCRIVLDPALSLNETNIQLRQRLQGIAPEAATATRDELLVTWANDPRCQSTSPSTACPERYRRLRRVDMRVDFVPRTQ